MSDKHYTAHAAIAALDIVASKVLDEVKIGGKIAGHWTVGEALGVAHVAMHLGQAVHAGMQGDWDKASQHSLSMSIAAADVASGGILGAAQAGFDATAAAAKEGGVPALTSEEWAQKGILGLAGSLADGVFFHLHPDAKPDVQLTQHVVHSLQSDFGHDALIHHPGDGGNQPAPGTHPGDGGNQSVQPAGFDPSHHGGEGANQSLPDGGNQPAPVTHPGDGAVNQSLPADGGNQSSSGTHPGDGGVNQSLPATAANQSVQPAGFDPSHHGADGSNQSVQPAGFDPSHHGGDGSNQSVQPAGFDPSHHGGDGGNQSVQPAGFDPSHHGGADANQTTHAPVHAPDASQQADQHHAG